MNNIYYTLPSKYLNDLNDWICWTLDIVFKNKLSYLLQHRVSKVSRPNVFFVKTVYKENHKEKQKETLLSCFVKACLRRMNFCFTDYQLSVFQLSYYLTTCFQLKTLHIRFIHIFYETNLCKSKTVCAM